MCVSIKKVDLEFQGPGANAFHVMEIEQQFHAEWLYQMAASVMSQCLIY